VRASSSESMLPPVADVLLRRLAMITSSIQ
jgi:hypothetical protein